MPILVFAVSSCTLSLEERGEINRYLTCDDCVESMGPVVVAMGWRAMPRLEGALVGPDTTRVAMVRENAGRAYAFVPGSEMTEDAFANEAVMAYVSLYQARAAVALGEIGRRSVTTGCFYRQLYPPLTCRQQAHAALDSARVQGDSLYTQAVRQVIQEQLDALPMRGYWTGTRYFWTVFAAFAGVTIVTISLISAG